MKKRLITIISTIAFALLSFVTPAYAQVKIPSPIGLGSIGEAITTVSGAVPVIAILGFIASVIYAGFVRMFALGNPEKEGKSMKIATGAAIGFAIIALAPVIVNLISKIIGVDEEIVT